MTAQVEFRARADKEGPGGQTGLVSWLQTIEVGPS